MPIRLEEETPAYGRMYFDGERIPYAGSDDLVELLRTEAKARNSKKVTVVLNGTEVLSLDDLPACLDAEDVLEVRTHNVAG